MGHTEYRDLDLFMIYYRTYSSFPIIVFNNICFEWVKETSAGDISFTCQKHMLYILLIVKKTDNNLFELYMTYIFIEP